ncbi:Pyruvate/Phosphoenolpyruvate kinase-like domain [Phytophthora cactorum]|nr:Pyruvate/Phosphoenolpyruvate kinase-like domain [Phytophthora cactorum]
MVRSAATVCESLRNVPCIGDGDTGYGNAMNVKRTVRAYAQAGMAGIMLEDQVAPKRCGHTAGKAVTLEKRLLHEYARLWTPAEKDTRCKEFARLGADITFLEAPQSVEEMETYCREVPGPKMANMVENGLTPVLLPEQLGQMGYNLAAYPITLLSASIKAMEEALRLLKCQTGGERKEDTGENATPSAELDNLLCDFAHVKDVVGFTEYYAEEARYKQ